MDKANRQEAEERRHAMIERRIAAIGIPLRFSAKTLANYGLNGDGEQRDAMLRARDTAVDYVTHWKGARHAGQSMMFIGRPGTGKTHLAVGIAREIACRYGANVRYVSFLDVIERIKDAWRGQCNEGATDIINGLTRVDLLIIDEISASYGTSTERLQLFRIINKRYENVLPTILISNAALDETRRIVGEAAFDRLREGGGCAVVFDWGSYRAPQKGDA